MPQPAIHIAALTRSYGSRRGISDVSLSVEPGALFGFLGPNGAGKTTTIRVLLGFLQPTSGQASALGLDCWRESDRLKQDVGAIPGDLRLWPWLSGRAALKLFSRIRGRDMRPYGEQIAEELELDLSVRVRAMSRGMRQKLGLILAMAHKPRLLILDEPTTALDPLMQDRLRGMLRRCSNQGDTVFFSSHTLGEVQALCERIAIVKQGRIIADTTVHALAANAGHEVMLRWKPGAEMVDASALEPHVVWNRRDATIWSGILNESRLPDLLTFSSQHRDSLEDFRVARPNLEALFMRFYETEQPGNGASVSGGQAPQGEARP